MPPVQSWKKSQRIINSGRKILTTQRKITAKAPAAFRTFTFVDGRWQLPIALGVLAVVSLLGLVPFGPLTAYMPYVFSVLAVVFLIVTFMGSTQTLDTPPMDFDEERVKLHKRRQQAHCRVEQTTEKLTHIQDKFQKVLREMSPELCADDSEELVVFIAQARRAQQTVHRAAAGA